MPGLLSRIIDFVLYSNLWIALAALSFTYQTSDIFKIEKNAHVFLFTFAATLLIYSAFRIVGMTPREKELASRRTQIILAHKYHLIFYSVIAGLAIFYSLYFFTAEQWTKLLIPFILTLVYIAPINYNKKIRELPFIKAIMVGVVWTWLCVYFPLATSVSNLENIHWAFVLEKFLFILSITIPFDIRDFHLDLSQNIKTIPNTFGVSGSKIIVAFVTLCCFFLALYLKQSEIYHHSQWVFLSIFYPILTLYIFLLNMDFNDYWYSGGLDGSILLQSLLLWLLN